MFSTTVFGEQAKECKPDYEARAASLKKSIAELQVFMSAVKDFSSSSHAHRFDKINSLAEFYGGLAITLHEFEKHYDQVLEMIERG